MIRIEEEHLSEVIRLSVENTAAEKAQDEFKDRIKARIRLLFEQVKQEFDPQLTEAHKREVLTRRALWDYLGEHYPETVEGNWVVDMKNFTIEPKSAAAAKAESFFSGLIEALKDGKSEENPGGEQWKKDKARVTWL